MGETRGGSKRSQNKQLRDQHKVSVMRVDISCSFADLHLRDPNGRAWQPARSTASQSKYADKACLQDIPEPAAAHAQDNTRDAPKTAN